MESVTGEVPSVLQFRSSDLLGITGLELSGSPGRVSVDNVNTVVIEKSVFQ